jgi:hypothetical protein
MCLSTPQFLRYLRATHFHCLDLLHIQVEGTHSLICLLPPHRQHGPLAALPLQRAHTGLVYGRTGPIQPQGSHHGVAGTSFTNEEEARWPVDESQPTSGQLSGSAIREDRCKANEFKGQDLGQSREMESALLQSPDAVWRGGSVAL